MMSEISFIGYGRATRGEHWYIAPIGGVSRVHIIHSGEVVFRSGDIEHTLRGGRIYVFPQNLAFRLVTNEKTRVDHTFFDFFSLPVLVAKDILEIVPEEHPLLSAAAGALCQLALTKDQEYRETLEEYMKGFLFMLNKELGLSFLDHAFTVGAIEYIHRNFKEKISVSDMAKINHMEKNVFIRKFKRCVGITPYQYIKNHRIHYAVSLIRSKRYTLGEIAQMSGYADQSALSHAIKSACGLYPEQISD